MEFKLLNSDKIKKMPEDKKTRVINAAMEVFGRNGYKKATMDEIVERAEISKGLIFHYFGNKKNLYLYLYEFSGDLIYSEMMNKMNFEEQDFFDKIKQASDIKVSVLNRHPHMFEFMRSAYFEEDADIAGQITMITSSKYLMNINIKSFFESADKSKFREGIDSEMALRIVLWCSNGFVSELEAQFEIDTILKDFDRYLTTLKKAFYKEEFH